MARPLRLHIPGAIQHVISRGNNGQTIFTDDVDCARYLEILADVLERFGVRCHQYALMVNHVHLVLRVGDRPLWRMMQQLNSRYCQWFNRRHGRVGHVLQGRYKSVLVEGDEHLLRLLAYVAMNPVKANLAARPEDWKWSSTPALLGLTSCPEFLDPSLVRAALHPFQSTQGPDGFAALLQTAAAAELEGVLIVATAPFAARVEPILATYRLIPEYVYAERYATRASLMEVLTDPLASPHRETAALRAFQRYAYTLREIAEAFGRSISTIWSWVQKGRNAPPERLAPNPLIVVSALSR